MLPDRHGLLDHEARTDHARDYGILLPAQDVIDLLVDRREVVGDLVHGLLHRQLSHDARRTRQHRRVGQECSMARRELQDVLDLSVLSENSSTQASA